MGEKCTKCKKRKKSAPKDLIQYKRYDDEDDDVFIKQRDNTQF